MRPRYPTGHHPLLAYCDNTAEPLAGKLRRGGVGSNTAADHLEVLDAAITALPPAYRRRLMITADGAGASHGLIERLDALACRPGHQLIYSAGWELGERERAAITAVPQDAWAAWPATLRVFARREHPHPGAQLTLSGAADGWRYSLWVTNLPARTPGWRGQVAYIDAAHRVHARVEDAIRAASPATHSHSTRPGWPPP